MELAPAVERRRNPETPLTRLRAAVLAFLIGVGRTTALAAALFPLLIFSFLTVDIPVRAIDHWFAAEVAKPGAWLSRGDVLMACFSMAGVLIARRFGGEEAGRAITVAWGAAALGAFAGVAWLAPELDPGDLPTGRYVAVFVASAMMGQYVAVGLFDVLRGGESWWRAPLYALLTGYAVQGMLFFPAVYWASGAPWAFWMASDFAIKAVLAFAFVGIYRMLSKRLRPRGGFGR